MSNPSILSRSKQVGNFLRNARKVVLDPGVLFSGLHAIIFSGSPSFLIQGLGIASLALTASVSTLRNVFPEANKKIASRFNNIAKRLHAPDIDSLGFPLFLNGVVLTGIAGASLLKGDYLSASISMAYAIANTDKGARLSGNTDWTLENICQKAFRLAGKDNLADNPPRFIQHSLYLPELWGSAGALIYGASHSGLATIGGAFAAAVAVTAAAVNNMKNEEKSNWLPTVPDTIRGRLVPSGQVTSRMFMAFASAGYAIGAVSLGNYMPAVGHGLASIANGILTKQDRARQLAAHNPV